MTHGGKQVVRAALVLTGVVTAGQVATGWWAYEEASLAMGRSPEPVEFAADAAAHGVDAGLPQLVLRGVGLMVVAASAAAMPRRRRLRAAGRRWVEDDGA